MVKLVRELPSKGWYNEGGDKGRGSFQRGDFRGLVFGLL